MGLLRKGASGAQGLSWIAAGLAVAGLLVVLLSPEPGGRGPGHAVGNPVPAPSPVSSTGEGLGRFHARVAALEHAVEQDPEDRDRILELARLLHDGHKVEDALPLYRRAVELDPHEPSAVYDLSSALLALARRREARETLEDYLERAPGDATTLYNLGVVLAAAGDPAAARRRWLEARDAHPDPGLRARIEERLATNGPRGPP